MSGISLIIIFGVISNEVIALDQSLRQEYRQLCRESLETISNSLALHKIIEFYRKKETVDDCFHSLSDGFHFTKDICEQIKETISEGPNALTAFPHNNNAVIFINIPIISKVITNDNMTQKFELESSDWLKNSDFYFVIWLKEQKIKDLSFHSYRIEYNSKDQKLIKLNSSDLEDQIILEEPPKQLSFTITLIDSPDSLKAGPNPYNYILNDSYLIVCSESNCHPFQENERISCKCRTHYNMTAVYIVLTFLFIWLIIAIKPIVEWVFNVKKRGKIIDVVNNVNCNSRTAKYEYLIILRIAKGTQFSDLTSVTIDVELLSTPKDSIAPGIRFSAKALEEKLLSEVRIYMFRLTKMPELKKIRCNHSGKNDCRIILFGVLVICRRGRDKSDIRIYKINKNINREVRTFDLHITSEGERMSEDEETQLKSIRTSNIRLSYLEMLWILFLNIVLIGSVAFYLSFIFILLPLDFSTLLEMLCTVLISTSVAIVFNILLVKTYKCLLFNQLRQQSRMYSKGENLANCVIIVYYVVSIIMAIAFMSPIGYINFGKQQIETYIWFCETLFSFALFIFIWNISSHFITKFILRENKSEDDYQTIDLSTVSSTSVNSSFY